MLRFLSPALAMLMLFSAAPALESGEPDAASIASQAAELKWDFPTSSGRPVKRPGPEMIERAMTQRQKFADAARHFKAAGDLNRATKIAAETWRLWVMARDEAGGRRFLADILDSTSNPAFTRDRALALYGDGLLAFRLERLKESRGRCVQALESARTSGDAEAQALAFLGLSRIELSEHNASAALECSSAARNLANRLAPAFGQAPLHMVAQSHRLAENWKEAARLFRESLQLNRQLEDTGMVVVELHNLGHVELRLGNTDAAEKLFAELAELEGPPQDPYGVALSLFNQAAVAHGRGDRSRAESLLRQARQNLASAGIVLASDDAQEFERLERELVAPPSR